jgi:subtilisin-like proprotein convertase family protein
MPLKTHRVHLLCAAFGAALFLPSQSARAQERFEIHDAGQPRVFELALDEVGVTTPEAHRALTKIDKAADRDALKTRIRAMTRATGHETELVLYEIVDGARRGPPRFVSSEVLVEVEAGADAKAILKSAGAVSALPAGPGLTRHWIARASDSAAALDLAIALRQAPGVVSAEPLLGRRPAKRLAPNDPFFTNQWHLLNTGQFSGTFGIDVRVTNVWDTYRGTNIYVAIIDDGVQLNHPDLASNIDTNLDWDFNGNDNNPSPGAGDDHGTACAGVAAARGNNGIGVSGVAPDARLVAYRLIAGAPTDAQEAAALLTNNATIQIKSNSWGPNDDGQTLEGPGTLARTALSNACFFGRGGRGTLIFWAGGNGLDANDDSNKDGYANSIYTIAIGAVANTGIQSWYSEPGANIVVVAPSSGDNTLSADVGIWTTDRTGSAGYNNGSTAGEPANADYTATFGGTSSACPLAAGVGALILQANPLLGWRDVQEILIRTATRNHASDPGWRTNGAGLAFNHKYGAGLINASGAVARALTWTNLGPQLVVTTNNTTVSAIPDNNAEGVTRSFALTNTLRVEHAVVTLSATHPFRGDLRVELISPSAMTSVLARTHGDPGDNYASWPFMSVQHWGENAAGTWTVRVADRAASDTGTLTAVQLALYGTGPAVSNQPPTLAPIGDRSVVTSNTLAFNVSAVDLIDDDPITLTASNLPAGALFGATNGAGAFFWTNANPTGVYSVTFYAADKDGTNSETIAIAVIPPGAGGATNYIVNFEGAGETKTSYASSNVVLSGLNWNLSDVLIGTSVNTDRMNGARSARVRTNGVMTMLADITGGVQTVSFLHGMYGGDSNSTLALDYSVNGGTTWVNAGTVSVASTTLTLFSTNIAQPGAVRLRIRHAGPSGSNRRANVDDIITTSFGGGPAKSPPVLNPIGAKFVAVSNALAFTVTADSTDGDPVTLTASNLPPGALFGATNETGAFSWPVAAPAGVYTTVFHAADADGVASETVLITVSAGGSAVETFTLLNAPAGSYGSGSYTGDAGRVWTYSGARVTNNAIDGRALLFGTGGVRFVQSQPLTGGVGTISLKYMKGFTAAGARNLDVFVNTQLVGQVTGITNTMPMTASFTGIDISGVVTIRIASVGSRQVIVDTLSWTGFDPPSGDSDGDGIDDAWELQFFASLTNVNAASDWDGDFFLDIDEFRAGTIPTNSASLLRFESVAAGGETNFLIRWQSASNKLYNVGRSTNLLTGFTTLATNLPATPPENVFTDAAPPAAGAIYRVDL